MAAEVNTALAEIPKKSVIVVVDEYGNRRLDVCFDDAIEALATWNHPYKIFKKGGSLVKIDQDNVLLGCKIKLIRRGELKKILAEAAVWEKRCQTNHGVHSEYVHPDKDTSDAVFESSSEWYNIPPLVGLTNTPVPRDDGTFNPAPGYDDETGYYYEPNGLEVPAIPEKPTQEDAKAAAKYLLDELFYDFPLKDDSSKANMLAALISPVLRPMSGITPLFVITKPSPGEGAGLLVDIVSLVSGGRSASITDPNGKDAAEWRKILISGLREGAILLNLDNLDINATFDSPVIAGFLTAAIYKDRLLGQSATLEFENTMILFLTGRNVKIGGDIPRRTVLVEMEALDLDKLHNPTLRDFKHSNIISWIKENRGTLVSKIFTMYRAWVLAGRPADKVPQIGKFEKWCDVVGGVLQFAGVNGFLCNRDTIWNEMDSESDEWQEFAAAWYAAAGERKMKAIELQTMIRQHADLIHAMPDAVQKATARGAKSVGRAISSQRDVPLHGGYMIRAKKNNKKVFEYWVEKKEETKKAGF